MPAYARSALQPALSRTRRREYTWKAIMAIGPNDTSEDELRDRAMTVRLEEEIDRQLADFGGVAPTVDLRTARHIPSAVQEEIRRRYVEAGWGEVAFTHVIEEAGDTLYKVAFLR